MDSKTITAPTLDELMDKLEDATPVGKFAAIKVGGLIKKATGLWEVTFTLKERL